MYFSNEESALIYGTLNFYSKHELAQAVNAGKTEAVLLELDRLLRSVSKYDTIPEELKDGSDDHMDTAIVRLDDSLKDESASEYVHTLVSLIRTYIASNASHIFEEDL